VVGDMLGGPAHYRPHTDTHRQLCSSTQTCESLGTSDIVSDVDGQC